MNSTSVLRQDESKSLSEVDEDIIFAATVAGDDFQKTSKGLQRDMIDEPYDIDSST
jgi:hypothetical protein